MTNRVLQKGFGAGELTSSLFARSDLNQYQMGASKIENFVVLPQGAIRTRGGLALVGKNYDNNFKSKLIPFRYSSSQTYILEFCNNKVRIISNGGFLITDKGVPYEFDSPYSDSDLDNLDYSQNADIVTFTTVNKPPYDLKRYDTYDWRFELVDVSPFKVEFSNLSYKATYPSNMTDAENKTKDKVEVNYKITAVDKDGRESEGSQVLKAKGNYYITGAAIEVSWECKTENVDYFKVYREVCGIYGFVGETSEKTLKDTGLNPDTTKTPPIYKEPFTPNDNISVEQILVNASGNGYWYGTNDGGVYYPQILYINAIPPMMTELCDSIDDPKIVNFNPSVTVKIVYTDETVAYDNPYSDTLSIKTVIKEVKQENDTVKYRKIAYLDTTKLIRLTQKFLCIKSKYLKLIIENFEGVIDCTTNYEELKLANEIYSQEVYKQLYESKLEIKEFLKVFSNPSSKCYIPLKFELDKTTSIVEPKGYAVSIGGSISYCELENYGNNLNKDGVNTVSIDSVIGEGADLEIKLTEKGIENYPSSVTYFDQRRVMAGSINNPLKIWFTNAGYYDMMVYHMPILDDDRIEIVALSSDADRIKHVVALDGLILLTGSAELRVFTQNSDALTPKSITVRPQSFIGANNVQPVIVNNVIIYGSQRGGHLRALGYSYNQQGYTSEDISIRAPHLFDGTSLKSLTVSKSPNQVLWCVMDNGMLLSCSFLPEQSQIAWSRHSSKDGIFEDVCAIQEGNEDHVYLVVNRNGTRYIERMGDFMVASSPLNYRYLDSYLEGNFVKAQTLISGLEHLEGEEVAVWADGKQQRNKVVQQGLIELDEPAHNVAVGLPIENSFISVPLIANYEAELQGRTKNISQVYLRSSYDGTMYAMTYPSGKWYECTKVDKYKQTKGDESYLTLVQLSGEWDEQTQFAVKHTDCKPLEIQAICLDISYEGGK